MEKTKTVYGLFTKVGLGNKEFIHDKGVFIKEADAHKEWAYALSNGCWIEEIEIR